MHSNKRNKYWALLSSLEFWLSLSYLVKIYNWSGIFLKAISCTSIHNIMWKLTLFSLLSSGALLSFQVESEF